MNMNSFVSLVVVLLSCFSCSVSGFFSSSNQGPTCPEPQIENGDHQPHAWFTWTHKAYAKIAVTCDQGFQLDGPAEAVCKLSGEWNRIPKCVVIEGEESVASRARCPLPPIGEDVDVMPMKQEYEAGEVVTFACPGVRKADAHMATTCGQDGDFHPKPPQCIAPRCVRPEVPENGGLRPNKQSYAVGDVVQFKCGQDYVLDGAENTTCGEDGYFPYTETSCKAKKSLDKTCRKPKVTGKQIISPEKEFYAAEEKVYYFCDRGFKSVGPSVLECRSYGEWSKIPPKCKRVYCIRPKSPSNGRLSNPWRIYYAVGQSVNFVCSRGYQLTEESSMKCGPDGHFEGQVPRCQYQGYRRY